jgi:hypothetical protein
MASTSPSGQSTAGSLIERLPSALLIAGASAASYWLAHLYESAFLGYFGFPTSLVRVSTNTTIVAAGAALSVIWFAFTLAVPVAEFFRRWDLDRNMMLYVSVTLFRAFASLFIDASDWHVWLEQGAIIVGLFVFFWGVHRIGKWAEKKTADKARQAAAQTQAGSGQPATAEPARAQASMSAPAATAQPQTSEAPPVPPQVASASVARVLMPWIGREGLLLVFVLFQAKQVAVDAGRAEARKAEMFFTFAASSRPYVALRVYDDVLVSAPLDRLRHTVSSDILLVPAGKQAELAMRWEKVGPLEHADEQKTNGHPMSAELASRRSFPCLSCHAG